MIHANVEQDARAAFVEAAGKEPFSFRLLPAPQDGKRVLLCLMTDGGAQHSWSFALGDNPIEAARAFGRSMSG